MSIGLVFWILMLLWLVFGIYPTWTPETPNYRVMGGSLLLFILIALLGWHAFGPPIHA